MDELVCSTEILKALNDDKKLIGGSPMFFQKKTKDNNSSDSEPDLWRREPLELYEKIGRPIDRDPENPLRSSDGKPIQDFMVLFYKGKPDIRGVGGLLYAGEWINYGTKLYRVNTLLQQLELKELIVEELQLEESKFLVSQTRVDPRLHLFY